MSVKAVTRRGNPVWRVQVIREGGKFNRRRFLDRRTYLKRDAIEAEAELIAEYEASKGGGRGGGRGRATASDKNARTKGRTTPESIMEFQPTPAWELGKPGEVPLFAAFAEQYLAVQDHGRSGFKNKERTVRLHLIPFFGATPLSEISRRLIDQFKVKLRTPTGEHATSRRTRNATQPRISSRRKGGPKSPKTINNLLTTLRSILNLAYDYELVDRVPTSRRTRNAKQPRITNRRKGGPNSPKTINNMLTTLRSILNLAYDYELVDRVPRIKMEPVRKQDADVLDNNEVEAFLRLSLVHHNAGALGLRRCDKAHDGVRRRTTAHDGFAPPG